MELISRSVLVIVLISIIIKSLHKTHFGTDVQCSKHYLVEVIMRGLISAAIMSKETCYQAFADGFFQKTGKSKTIFGSLSSNTRLNQDLTFYLFPIPYKSRLTKKQSLQNRDLQNMLRHTN